MTRLDTPKHPPGRLAVRQAALPILLALSLAPLPGTACDTGPCINEARNAATGFAFTLWMGVVDSLGTHCGALPGEPGILATTALDQWRQRNMPLVNVAIEHLRGVEEFIGSRGGESAKLEFREQRKQEFVSSVREMQSLWFPDARIDAGACKQLAARAARGDYDVGAMPEFHRTLEAMLREAGK